jgi:hypothetical protein
MYRSLLCASRACALALSFVVLTACGGGGGGGGDGGSNNPPPADVANRYLPTDSSLKWVYNSGSTQLYFLAPALSNGSTVHSLVYPTGGKEHFITSASQIGLQGLYLPSITVGDGVTYTGDVRFNPAAIISDQGWTPGWSQSLGGSGTIEISPKYGRKSVTYTGYARYVGESSVSTGLGAFAARKIEVSLQFTVVVEGYSFTLPYQTTFYFAKDIGVVRREQNGTVYTLFSLGGPDRDSDGIPDAFDRFPDNPTEWRDLDEDGIGDTSDPDRDNDGVANATDAFPLDRNEWADFDGDGVGDNADVDDDNDGIYDLSDVYPHNSARSYNMTTGGEAEVHLAAGYAGTPANVSHDIYMAAGSDTLHWSASSPASWLHVAQVASYSTARFQADSTGLAPGHYETQATIHDNDTGEELVVPVTFDVELVQLYGSAQSIGLASLPSNSKLTQSITVKNSRGLQNLAWTASSNQSWLGVTPSGVGDSTLTITANPVGLATDTIHYATVSIGSGDPSVGSAQPIRVAIWVSGTAPAANAAVVATYQQMASDPLRPLVYVHNGGSNVDIYNIYTRALVGSITNVAPTTGAMQVSADGAYLFVRDTSAGTIVRIELDQVQNRVALSVDGNAFAELRPSGHSLLMSSTTHVFDATSGQQVESVAMWFAPPANIPQRAIAGNEAGVGMIDDAPMSRQRLYYLSTYTGSGSNAFLFLDYQGNDYQDYATDIALRPEGMGQGGLVAGGSTVLGNGFGSGPGIFAFNWGLLISTATVPTNIEIGYDNTIVGSTGSTVLIYNGDNTFRSSATVAGGDIRERQLTISADGRIVGALSGDRLTFVRTY